MTSHGYSLRTCARCEENFTCDSAVPSDNVLKTSRCHAGDETSAYTGSDASAAADDDDDDDSTSIGVSPLPSPLLRVVTTASAHGGVGVAYPLFCFSPPFAPFHPLRAPFQPLKFLSLNDATVMRERERERERQRRHVSVSGRLCVCVCVYVRECKCAGALISCSQSYLNPTPRTCAQSHK
jgi:hypothetical protein